MTSQSRNSTKSPNVYVPFDEKKNENWNLLFMTELEFLNDNFWKDTVED